MFKKRRKGLYQEKGKKLVSIKKKVLNRILIIMGLALLVIILVLFNLYYRYIDKENNLELYINEDNTQKIYILGTIHEYHFEPLLSYSYMNVQNVVENIKPDLLLLEVDQDIYNDYGVVKSPVEMIPLWCYAKEQNISVKGVDWFEVTENSRSWTTNKERDDHIFDNTMASIGDEAVVLIILGATHRIEQGKRFIDKGYKKEKIPGKAMFFQSNNRIMFAYPSDTVKELDKQIEYWNTVAMNKAITKTRENSEGRDYWVNRYKNLISSLNEIKETIFVPNALYK